MIIVRINLASDRYLVGEASHHVSNVGESLARPRGPRWPFAIGHSPSQDAYEMKSIAIEITQCKEIETDGRSLSGAEHDARRSVKGDRSEIYEGGIRHSQ